jgi:hypothetical protein
MSVKINNKFSVIVMLVALTSVGAAATSKSPDEVRYKNLKVLPKNISSKELQGLMVDEFEDGLGVTCDFCHAPANDGHGLDFVSDAKPEKEIAREMMQMTIDINKEYFKIKRPALGNASLVVTCNTCHKGVAFPDGSAQ